jgi:hypothetical protein
VLGIRPEGLQDAALIADDRRPRLRGRAELREALGSEVLLHFFDAHTGHAIYDQAPIAAAV